MEFRKKLKITINDYISFNIFSLKYRLILTPILFVILVPIAILALYRSESSDILLIGLIVAVIVGVALAALCTLINIASIRYTAKKQYQSSKAMQVESELTMDSAGVREDSEFGSTNVRWNDVYRAAASDTAYYIFFSRMQAFLIPKCLITHEEERTLFALLHQHLPAEKIKLKKRS